jgi:hypothetical protein
VAEYFLVYYSHDEEAHAVVNDLFSIKVLQHNTGILKCAGAEAEACRIIYFINSAFADLLHISLVYHYQSLKLVKMQMKIQLNINL